MLQITEKLFTVRMSQPWRKRPRAATSFDPASRTDGQFASLLSATPVLAQLKPGPGLVPASGQASQR